MSQRDSVGQVEDYHRSPYRRSSSVADFFAIPTPIRNLFDRVPLVKYPPNPLPRSSPKPANFPSLYIFSKESDAAAGRPSFNPSCLKWQTFLNIVGIKHILVSSNNHASPTGSLPFLLPAILGSQNAIVGTGPVVANKILKYASEQGVIIEKSANLRYEAYISLIDFRIRCAWLYSLYLEPRNFDQIAYPLYVLPVSSNPLVRASISYQLRAAAEAELFKYSSIIDVVDLYSEADKAFEALSTLLGEDMWFFANKNPTLFDASVFAYTQPLLDEGMGWVEKRLYQTLKTRRNLVEHRERLLATYYDRRE
ncbi:hypothetical protein K3495_g6834 [Podosphaera aphanis]|nr:hypothetical protein K3495_g6834 [Podosphaera aphanis]